MWISYTENQLESQQLHFQSSSLLKQQMAQVLEVLLPTGDTDQVSDSWLWLGLILAVESQLGMNQWMEENSPSQSFCLKQIHLENK